MSDLTDKARGLAKSVYRNGIFSLGEEHFIETVEALILSELQAARERTIEECIEAIELDKSTFARVVRDTKGHSRALMLCRELKERKDADAE
jgi:hypothetical protein